MRYGDVDGLGIIYTKDGKPILQHGERVVLVVSDVVFPLFVGANYQDTTLFTVYFTNKRIIGLRYPKPDKKVIWDRFGPAIGTGIDAYANELEVYEKGGMIYQEMDYKDVMKVVLCEKGLHLKVKDNNGKERDAGMGNNIKVVGLIKIEKLLKENKIPFAYRTKNLFIDILNRFKFGDVEGLNTIYDEDGKPILENDEYIISQVMTSPFVKLDDSIEMKSSFGILTKTNKRLIFIRKITNDDFVYSFLPNGSHIFFSFYLNSFNKIKMEGDNLVITFSTKGRLFWQIWRLNIYFPINEVRGILGEYL